MVVPIIRSAAVALALATVLLGPALAADDQEAELRKLVNTKILPFVQKSIVIDSVNNQNQKNATLNEQQIRRLDKIWRDEAKRAGGALINEVFANPLSSYLKQVKQDHGDLFAEIYVMDNKGLNVGQSDGGHNSMLGHPSFLATPHIFSVDHADLKHQCTIDCRIRPPGFTSALTSEAHDTPAAPNPTPATASASRRLMRSSFFVILCSYLALQ